ncbi:uncharacterized protein LOC141630328 [Silene latifolia]|uniref:uncharacterized protein LOC141630328 n=1 Tax=Silene latifolia TaxID=37657 RepID=UPI003D77728C
MPEHETAFHELKTYMATPPLLAKPNKEEPMTVYLSVSETAVSGVLVKNDNKIPGLSRLMVDFSPNRELDLIKEVNRLDTQKSEQEWILHVDGATNRRETGLRLVLKSPQGDIIAQAVSSEFKATINEADYEALIARLKLCIDLVVQNLKIKIDSLLISNQVKGTYAAKDSKMILYLEYAKNLFI